LSTWSDGNRWGQVVDLSATMIGRVVLTGRPRQDKEVL